MGYLYEVFDLMFATITSNVRATANESAHEAQYRPMQDVLRPYDLGSHWSVELLSIGESDLLKEAGVSAFG